MTREDKFDLLSRYLDDNLKPADVPMLEALLDTDPEFAQWLYELSMQHASLHRLAKTHKAGPIPELTQSDSSVADRPRVPAHTSPDRDDPKESRRGSQNALPLGKRTTRRFATPREARRRGLYRIVGLAAAGLLIGLSLLLFFLASRSDRRGMREEGNTQVEARKAIPEVQKSGPERAPREEAHPTVPEEPAPTEAERNRLKARIAVIERERQRLAESPSPKNPDPDQERKRQEELARLAEEQKKRESEQREAETKEKRMQEDLVRTRKETRQTVAATATFARIEQVKGEVYVLGDPGSEKSPVQEGQELVAGQGLLVGGAQSLAVVTHRDATRVEAGAGSEIRYLEGSQEIFLVRGKLEVQTAKLEKGQERIFTTPDAKIQSLGARFTLACGPASTRLEVHGGLAQCTDLWKGTTLQVKPGQQAVAQDGVDPKRVDLAIQKGIEYLKRADSSPALVTGFKVRNSDEFLLLTFVTAGVPESDPSFQKYFKNMMSAPFESIYKVALQAMVLEELDRVKYQKRIWACAQYLVDTQCADGLWSYGETMSVPVDPPAPVKADVETQGKPGAQKESSPNAKRKKPPVRQKIPVNKTRDGAARAANNSTAMYAALGLRACHDAGIIIPEKVIQRAIKYWHDNQIVDGKEKGVATGSAGTGEKISWLYWQGFPYPPSTLSMTTGAVGSLVIYDYMLGKDWKKDRIINGGINWIADHFSVSENTGVEGAWGNRKAFHYYYLYALERLGVLYDTPLIGRHKWYPEGARFLLAEQKPDGSWNNAGTWLGGCGETQPVWDTCFALLFLKRATRPLNDVASEDRYFKKQEPEKPPDEAPQK